MTPSIGVAEYYKNKTIFITGGTGFLGKVLVEKLLRCCPDLKRVYLLMRPKKGQNVNERLEDYFSCRVFEVLHEKSPKSFDKVTVIRGDVLQDDLGISIEDWDKLTRETEIVYHCAACVRFDMPIRDAVNMNVTGTDRVLKLADDMKNLEVFVHVSTSYCRCEVRNLEERLYPAKHRPQDIMDCVNWMDDDLLKLIQPKLIDPQPNTYSYTKSLTEDLVAQKAGKYPIVIARPSIVTAAEKEPLPGWVDNLNGPTGLLVGSGKGVVRSMYCHSNYQADVVPVDYVVNACVLLGYLTAIEKPKEIRVCNVTLSDQNPVTWEDAVNLGRVHVREFPSSILLWYPEGSPKSSKLHHMIAAFFVHLLPALLVDLLMLIMGKPTFMVKVQKRVSYGLNVLEYYTTNEWFFENDYYKSLKGRISKSDNEVFYTDLSIINWSEYMRTYMKGAREYCLKEDPSTLPQARKLFNRLYWLDKIMKSLIISLLAYFIYNSFVKNIIM